MKKLLLLAAVLVFAVISCKSASEKAESKSEASQTAAENAEKQEEEKPAQNETPAPAEENKTEEKADHCIAAEICDISAFQLRKNIAARCVVDKRKKYIIVIC